MVNRVDELYLLYLLCWRIAAVASSSSWMNEMGGLEVKPGNKSICNGGDIIEVVNRNDEMESSANGSAIPEVHLPQHLT